MWNGVYNLHFQVAVLCYSNLSLKLPHAKFLDKLHSFSIHNGGRVLPSLSTHFRLASTGLFFAYSFHVVGFSDKSLIKPG